MIKSLLDIFLFYGTFLNEPQPSTNATAENKTFVNASSVFFVNNTSDLLKPLPKLSRKNRQLIFMSSTAREIADGGMDIMDPSVFQIKSAAEQFRAELPPSDSINDSLVVFAKLLTEMVMKFFSSQELTKPESSYYFRIIPEYLLQIFTNPNSTENDCQTDMFLNVLDISTLSSRTFTNIIHYVQDDSGDDSDEAKGVTDAQELAGKTIEHLYNLFHNNCTRSSNFTLQTMEEKNMMFMINLLQKCHTQCDVPSSTSSKQTQQADDVDTEKVSLDQAFSKEVIDVVEKSIKKDNKILMPSETSNLEELVGRVVFHGGLYYFNVFRYATEASKDDVVKDIAMIHHKIYYDNFARMAKLTLAHGNGTDEEIFKFILPMTSMTQVIINLLEFINNPVASVTIKTSNSFEKLGGDIFDLVQHIKTKSGKPTTMKRPVTASSYNLISENYSVKKNIEKISMAFISAIFS